MVFNLPEDYKNQTLIRQALLEVMVKVELSHKKVARLIGIAENTLRSFIEHGKNVHRPSLYKIINFITDQNNVMKGEE